MPPGLGSGGGPPWKHTGPGLPKAAPFLSLPSVRHTFYTQALTEHMAHVALEAAAQYTAASMLPGGPPALWQGHLSWSLWTPSLAMKRGPHPYH